MAEDLWGSWTVDQFGNMTTGSSNVTLKFNDSTTAPSWDSADRISTLGHVWYDPPASKPEPKTPEPKTDEEWLDAEIARMSLRI